MNRKKKILGIVLIGVLIVISAVMLRSQAGETQASADSTGYTEAKVTKGYIKDSISNSSVIESEKRQQIKIRKAGTIEHVYVKEGEKVNKGDIIVMMEGDAENTNLEISKKNLELEMKNLEALNQNLKNTKIYAKEGGIYTKNDLNIKEGIQISENSSLGEIYEAEVMELEVLFNLSAKDNISIGDTAEVVIVNSFETIPGKVTGVYESSSMLDSGNFGYKATIEVPNKGALGNDITPQVTVKNSKGIYSSIEVVSIGKKSGIDIVSDVKGSLKKIYVFEGDAIQTGDLLFELDNVDILTSIEKQEINIEQKLLEISSKSDSLEDVAITAPISGTILSLTANDGDNVDTNDTVAVIADTEDLKVVLEVDELDIFEIELGQKATITSDVIKGKSYTGVVDNIAMEGKPENGVSTFDVAIALEPKDSRDFKLGINVDVEIIQGEKQDALILPVEAVKKMGNKYMVLTSIPNAEEMKDTKQSMRDSMQEVKVGIATDSYVEIVEGLSKGDTVYYSKRISQNSGMKMPNMMMGTMGGRPSNRKK